MIIGTPWRTTCAGYLPQSVGLDEAARETGRLRTTRTSHQGFPALSRPLAGAHGPRAFTNLTLAPANSIARRIVRLCCSHPSFLDFTGSMGRGRVCRPFMEVNLSSLASLASHRRSCRLGPGSLSNRGRRPQLNKLGSFSDARHGLGSSAFFAAGLPDDQPGNGALALMLRQSATLSGCAYAPSTGRL